MLSHSLELGLFLAASFVISLVQPTSAQEFWPSAIPLTVKTPYLNSWMDVHAENGTHDLTFWWTQYWTLNSVSLPISPLFDMHSIPEL